MISLRSGRRVKRRTKPKTAPKSVYVRKPIPRPYLVPRPEVKAFDYNFGTSASQTGTLTLLTQIAQGTGDTQRIGNTCNFLKMHFNAQVNHYPGAGYEYVRIIILMDKQGYNSPVVNDVLEPILVGGVTANLAQYNWNYAARFKILYDHSMVLTPTIVEEIVLNKTLTLGVKAHFIGTSTTFANQLYALCISSQSNILALPGINMSCRTTFSDN